MWVCFLPEPFGFCDISEVLSVGAEELVYVWDSSQQWKMICPNVPAFLPKLSPFSHCKTPPTLTPCYFLYEKKNYLKNFDLLPLILVSGCSFLTFLLSSNFKVWAEKMQHGLTQTTKWWFLWGWDMMQILQCVHQVLLSSEFSWVENSSMSPAPDGSSPGVVSWPGHFLSEVWC